MNKIYMDYELFKQCADTINECRHGIIVLNENTILYITHSRQTKPYGGMVDASSSPPSKMLSFSDGKVNYKGLDKTADTNINEVKE